MSSLVVVANALSRQGWRFVHVMSMSGPVDLAVEAEYVPAEAGEVARCPIYTLVLPFCRVPFEFLEMFFSHGTKTHLAPIRRYGEGSKHREFAEAITAYLVGEGYATPAEGNQPAAWRGPQGRADGLKSLGYEEE